MRHSLIILCVAALFMALSGFDCASTEMTTAKVALQRKDLVKAEESLRKEVAARPDNGDAWLLLGDIYREQRRFRDMLDAHEKARKATQPAIAPEYRQNLDIQEYNTWIELYETARVQYSDSNDTRMALRYLDSAEIVRPGAPDNLFLRATIHGIDSNVAMLAKSYEQYVDALRTTVEEGTKLGLTLGMTADQVEAKLGKPTRARVTDSTGGVMLYAPKGLYVYLVEAPTGPATVEGWAFFREDVPEPIRLNPLLIRTSPYVYLGLRAYNSGKSNPALYEQALGYLRTLEKLDPRQEGVGSTIAEIYALTGRTDVARKEYEDAIRNSPKEPANYIRLGNLLNESGDYNGAVNAFRGVLDLGLGLDNGDMQTALFNLGAVYKNWGAHLQDSLLKLAGDKITKAQIAVYQKPLGESVKFFEQLKTVKKDDLVLLTELAGLYDVFDEKGKLSGIVRELEGLEKKYEGEAGYWRALSRIYLILDDVKKSEAADKKATALGR